jgi:hypothetical protein
VWIAGAVLVVVAVLAFFGMRHTKSELHTMIGTQTWSIPELERFRGASNELGGHGHFRKVAEVVGAAHPRPEGLLKAELSKNECVWYRYRIDRRYEAHEYRDGEWRRRTRTEKVAEHTSHEGYALIDPQGRTIGVDPNGTDPDAVEQSVDRFEPHIDDGGGMELFGIRLPRLLTGRNQSTIGYHCKEWIIRPGRQLYILGEVHDKIGPLVIGKPGDGGHFLISTRTEDELRKHKVMQHRLLAAGTIAAMLGGLGLVIADLVS